MDKNTALSLYHEALEDYRHGRNADAETKLRQLLETAPGDDIYESLSVILYNQERYDEAITVLKNWIRRQPEALMAHTNLSRCYVAKGMIAEAEQEQSIARRITWKLQLKEKKSAAPPVDYQEQINKFRRIIELAPHDVLGYYSLASVYLELRKYREAMDTFEKAISVDTSHTSSYAGLGQALEALGDRDKACRIYREGIRVAELNGDMMPQRKMETRLAALAGKKSNPAG